MGILKKVGYTVVGLFVIGGIASCANGEEVTPSSKEVTKVAPKKENKITQANYDKLVQGDALNGEGGQSMDEVHAILGKPESTSKTVTGNTTMEVSTWSSWKDGIVIMVTFTNGKVSGKTITNV